MMGYCEVPDPVLISESIPPWQEEIHPLSDIDRMILEECGYIEGMKRYDMIFENVVADSDEEKIFTIDKHRSCTIDDTVDEILENEAFDEYWHKNIYDKLSDEQDGMLLEQWTDGFIGEEVKKHLSKMSKVEKFNYIDFFRDILSKSENPDAVNLIDFDDSTFTKMPNVMRLY